MVSDSIRVIASDLVDAKKTATGASTVLSGFPPRSFTNFAEFHGMMSPFHLYLYGPSRGPIETSFEEVEARLIRLPLLHFEPDGFFVWTRPSGQQQVSGMIYDAQCKLQYCDLRGHCSHEMWRELCVAITGGPCDRLEVMLLPNRQLQDLQSFEKNLWPETNLTER